MTKHTSFYPFSQPHLVGKRMGHLALNEINSIITYKEQISAQDYNIKKKSKGN